MRGSHHSVTVNVLFENVAGRVVSWNPRRGEGYILVDGYVLVIDILVNGYVFINVIVILLMGRYVYVFISVLVIL